MSLITFRNLTGYVLNVPRVDKEIDPNGSIQVEWADSDNLRYDEDIQALIASGRLAMNVPTEEKVLRPVPVYANAAAFPPAANYAEGTLVVDLTGGGAGNYLYVQVGGSWVTTNP